MMSVPPPQQQQQQIIPTEEEKIKRDGKLKLFLTFFYKIIIYSQAQL